MEKILLEHLFMLKLIGAEALILLGFLVGGILVWHQRKESK